MLRRLLVFSLLALSALAPVSGYAQGIVDATVNGNQVTARLELPGGLGGQLVLDFENAEGLDLGSLGLSARVVDPLTLLGRLPLGVTPAPSFPVLIRVAPPAGSPLAFHGVYNLSLHTENLAYSPDTPLRLFKAPANGVFADITESMGAGSYRVRGTGGTFSDFLILADLRGLDAVIGRKFDVLGGLLDAHAVTLPPALLADLRALLAEARAAFAAGSPTTAIQKLQLFNATVIAQSGTAIPDLWMAGSPAVNVAGLLRSGATTTIFSLSLKSR